MNTLTRTLRTVTIGKDVEGVTRAMLRYLGDDKGWKAFVAATPVVKRTWGPGKTKLAKRCAAKAGLPQYGVFGPGLETALRKVGAFDLKANRLLDEYAESVKPKPPPDPALAKARAMLAYARAFTGTYQYGGGHGQDPDRLNPAQNLDCSSSTSLLLHHFGLLGSSDVHVSGWFETWGEQGRGKYVTVHANDDHVWVEFNLPEGYFRFDTSPHGDGPRGPRVRTSKRFDSTFFHRHPAGL